MRYPLLHTPADRFGDLNISGALPEMHSGRYAKMLIATIICALAALLGWSALTSVNEITTGTGVLRTRALPEQIEHPYGGVAAEIMVAEGDRLQPGTTIMVFDTTTLVRELTRQKALRDSLAAEFGRLDFILENKGSVPEFTSLSELSPEELLFWAEQSYLDAQLELIESDRNAIVSGLKILEARSDKQKRELEILRGSLARAQRGRTSGVVSQNATEQLEREVLKTERTVLELQGQTVAQRNAVEASVLKRKELLAKRQRDAALRRADIDGQLTSAVVSIAEIKARISSARVVAGIDGTVMKLSVSRPREVVAPGDVIASIVPTDSDLLAEIEIPASRIGTVETGMEARLKVQTYDFTRYGELVGTVASVSPSSYENAIGATVFKVIIDLSDVGKSARLGNHLVKPGMTVTAEILSDSKKILTYLLKPLRALADRAFTES